MKELDYLLKQTNVVILNDIVVINGTYLLNSEAILKNGSDKSMAGMKM